MCVSDQNYLQVSVMGHLDDRYIMYTCSFNQHYVCAENEVIIISIVIMSISAAWITRSSIKSETKAESFEVSPGSLCAAVVGRCSSTILWVGRQKPLRPLKCHSLPSCARLSLPSLSYDIDCSVQIG